MPFSYHIPLLSGLILCLLLIQIGIRRWHALNGLFTCAIFIFFIVLGNALHSRLLPVNQEFHFSHRASYQNQNTVLEIQEILKPTSYQHKYIGKVYSSDGHYSSGKLLVNINKDSVSNPKYGIGNRLYVRGSIDPLPVTRNPYQFDYGKYLRHKGIYGQLSASNHQVMRLQQSGSGVRVVVSRFRESVQEKLASYPFSKDQLAIINALIIGQRQGIDREMSNQYAAAGMMHILAVSGLHVGIILLLLRFITRPISGYRLRFLRSGIIIGLIWLFAILTGLSPSVLRAATMFSFLEASSLTGSKKETLNALIASAFVLLLFDPLLIYQVGFQLSYAAVLAILWIQPWLSSLFTIKNKVLRFLWNTITVTTAAQIGVLPLSLFYFHQFPGLFLVSNLVVLPVLGILLATGISVVIMARLDILPEFMVVGFGKAIDFLNFFIGWVASKEDFVFKHITISLAIMLGLYAVVIAVIALFKKYSFTRLSLALGSIVFLCGVFVWQKIHSKKSELIIFHKNKQTLIATYTQGALLLKTQDSLWDYASDTRITAYSNNVALDTIIKQPLSNIISYKDKRILILDSLAIFALKGYEPDYILLTQSPNINLDRLINTYPKTYIIADGTNYKSDIDRWKASCRKRKIPFHSTYEKGAFIVK